MDEIIADIKQQRTNKSSGWNSKGTYETVYEIAGDIAFGIRTFDDVDFI